MYLIVGGDDFLAERRRLQVVAQVRKAAGNTDLPVELRKASEIDAGELAELLSPSLFSEDRIVAVAGLAEASKDTAQLIESAVADPAPGVRLILQHTGKGRQKALVASLPKTAPAGTLQVLSAEELRGRERVAFIDTEFREAGVRVSPDVTEALLDAVGTDLRELASAVSQLVSDTGGQVTAAAVHRYYQGSAEVSGFDVAEFAVSGRTDQAVGSARRALQLGVPHVLLASALSGMVGDIAKVHGVGRINARQQAAEFGMPPWKLEKTVRLARTWSAAGVAAAVQVVAELDAGVKGWAADPEYAVEDAVRRISLLARE
ncbi:DNA polymerase III subunit delta [Corynebacterium terpenotabidum Y-11]|uniref:DNA-directed DNA polymerase n=1 Tax=Corynebacterium terpenotabidum Y-11 TaxID=1200352 RepID=S4XID9_9CORY|nr:DNA polymerase III subunit delta [Corynebacterium terpenotabidum Y-11]